MTSLINTPEKLTDEEFESLPWILSCQKDSYKYSNNDSSQKKKKKKRKKKSNEPKVIEPKYGILLNDTVFFPEGGGQPHDTGDIIVNDKQTIQVVNCQRPC